MAVESVDKNKDHKGIWRMLKYIEIHMPFHIILRLALALEKSAPIKTKEFCSLRGISPTWIIGICVRSRKLVPAFPFLSFCAYNNVITMLYHVISWCHTLNIAKQPSGHCPDQTSRVLPENRLWTIDHGSAGMATIGRDATWTLWPSLRTRRPTHSARERLSRPGPQWR